MARITPIDDELVIDGTWTNYLGVPLRIARANNDKFKKIFRQLSKPYNRQIENNSLPEDVAEDILTEALSKAILVDWDSSKFPDNVKYSHANAKDLLIHDPDCRDFVIEFSREAENFYIQENEEEVGK